MDHVQEVDIAPLAPELFESVLGDAYPGFERAFTGAKTLLSGRTIWNVNSTGKGGGVAEMLRSLIAYAEGAGVETRWLVVSGNPDFFAVTKRIHNHLHGATGDGGALADDEHEIYEQALRPNAEELVRLVSAKDVVILHDPQTAGLCDPLKEKGVTVIWRCHVGLDTPNDVAREAWRFLRPYLTSADAYIFSREAFVWDDLPDEKIVIIPPSIDAFSPKNQEMEQATVDAILDVAGLVEPASTAGRPNFTRVGGGEGTVTRRAEMDGTKIPVGARLVVQVSRWDRLKDPLGVMTGFADNVAPTTDARLVLAGPSVTEVADDPEGAGVLSEVQAARSTLPPEVAARVHLVCLPMDDGEENAAMVNALQRRAEVIVQKSLAEGFGLTVAEGMWKSRPVVASRIGGIQDQVEDGRNGVLLDDPRDLTAFGRAVVELLEDEAGAEAMGAAARERVRERFLGARHLMQYLELIEKLIE